MWPNPEEAADLVTFTEEILNAKLFVQWTNFVRTVSLKPTNSKNKLKKTEAKMLKSKAMFFFSIN